MLLNCPVAVHTQKGWPEAVTKALQVGPMVASPGCSFFSIHVRATLCRITHLKGADRDVICCQGHDVKMRGMQISPVVL